MNTMAPVEGLSNSKPHQYPSTCINILDDINNALDYFLSILLQIYNFPDFFTDVLETRKSASVFIEQPKFSWFYIFPSLF